MAASIGFMAAPPDLPNCDEDDAVELDTSHVVLLGDSTLDNGRYLNLANGDLSVGKQMLKRCNDERWELSALAQDGSMLEDVLLKQLPLIPGHATHIVLSASGNDLLFLLNEMVEANFSTMSMYRAVVTGLLEVSQRYRDLLQALKSLGCHLSCCTVYRPNFNNYMFKSLAIFALGLHNSRIHQISLDLDCSVIDLANMFESAEDFANPLELSSLGGFKVAMNIAAFVAEHPPFTMTRFRDKFYSKDNQEEDDQAIVMDTTFGLPRCCATRVSSRKVYCSKQVPKATFKSANDFQAPEQLGRPLQFSEEQQCWRET